MCFERRLRESEGGNVKQVNMEDEDGRVLSEKNEAYERWEQYSEGLFNGREEKSAEVTARHGTVVRLFEKNF